METQTVLRKLDDILIEMSDFKSHNKGGMLTMLRVGKKLPFHSMDELTMFLRKLDKDGYVRSITDDIWVITADGFIFQGYVKQAITDAQTEKRIMRNENLLIRGTWFAGIAAILLLAWQIFQYYYPPHADAVHVILQK